MRTRHVVTGFLEREGRVLLLRRSVSATTYPGLWAGVSGYVEASPPEQVRREILEETGYGANDVELLVTGEPIFLEDESCDTEWVIHPFLFRVHTAGDPVLNDEHSEWKWVEPSGLATEETVQGLAEAYERLCSSANETCPD